jgi:hypothetical protein
MNTNFTSPIRPDAMENGHRSILKWTIALLLLIVLITRVVFYADGFGSHPDEWRVLRSGVIFWLDGIYWPSRLPGYPLNEILMGGGALLGGPILCAALSTIASCLAVFLFARLLDRYAPEAGFWPVLAFALHPWFWAAGITSLDPIWGLTLLLAALLAVENEKNFWAGFASGLAVGFRPTALIWCGIVFLRAIQKNGAGAAVRGFIFGASLPLGFAATLYLSANIPGGDVSGLSFLLNIGLRNIALAAYRTVEFLGGIPGAIAFLSILALRASGLWATIRQNFLTDYWHLAAISVFFMAQFVIISDKPEYLFPVMPFLFLVMAKALPWRDWAILSAVFVFSALIGLDFGSWGHNQKPSFDVNFANGPVLLYSDKIRIETADAKQYVPTSVEGKPVIRVKRSHHVLQNAYVLGLLQYNLQDDKKVSARPVMAEIFKTTADQPITIREWSEIGSVKGSSAALYFPSEKKLYVNGAEVSTDLELLNAVKQWHGKSMRLPRGE